MLSWPRSQDPDDIRKRGFDWAAWLTGTRSSITTSTVVVVEGTVVVDQQTIAGGITSFRVTGGLDGETALIRNRVTFDNGEQVDQTARLRIKAN